MSVQAIKQQLQDLAQRRSVIERKITEAGARLEAAGVGMHDPLVDSEVRCCDIC